MTATLQHPDTAPKDGTTILADFGYPSLTVAVWNAPSGKWVAAELHADLYQGEWNDTYFQNEHEPQEAMRGWLPFPVVRTGGNVSN